MDYEDSPRNQLRKRCIRLLASSYSVSTKPTMLEFSPLLSGMQRWLTAQIRNQESTLPLTALVVTGLGVAALTGASSPRGTGLVIIEEAHAGGAPGSNDFDGDGLSNEAERILGSYEYQVDTDLDGYSDLEEFARGSVLTNPNSVPLPGALAMQMSASGELDGVHLQLALYFTDNDFSNKNVEFGFVANGQIRLLPWLLAQSGVTVTQFVAMNGGGSLLLFDVPFSESLVLQAGELSVFATLNVDGSPVIDAAAGVDLVGTEDDIVMMLQSLPQGRWQAYQAQLISGQGGTGPSSGSFQQSGGVYQPIPTGGGGTPDTWEDGQICYQASVEIGADGSGITSHEVVAADCISGWNSACPGDCADSVGETFHTFDPLGLIGG
ncbi:MAG: hypothetical protein ACI8X5_001235 [Planctomycetota bacterium]|jgi:hypothetical protein